MDAPFCARLGLDSEQVEAGPSITAIDARVLTRMTHRTRQVEMVNLGKSPREDLPNAFRISTFPSYFRATLATAT